MTYEERIQARRERLEAKAAIARRKAENSYKDAMAEVAGIPPGQPILVGHHSEGRHRRALERHDRKMRQAIEAQRKAEHFAYLSHGTTGVQYSDDDAIEVLREKIAKKERRRDTLKEVNKLIRRFGGSSTKPIPEDRIEEAVDALAALDGVSEKDARNVTKPDHMGRYGIPGYVFRNLSSEIRRLKGRLETAERLAAAPDEKEIVCGIEIESDTAANRLRVYFPDKPSEAVRTWLKSHGFRWAPSMGAWQRHLHSSSDYVMDGLRALLEEHYE